MASHIRYILQCRGGWLNGSAALKELSTLSHYHGGKPVRTTAEAIKTAARLGVHLWVFREPRHTEHARSQYQKLCSFLGCGKKRKVVKFPAVPEVVIKQAQQLFQQNMVPGGLNAGNHIAGQAGLGHPAPMAVPDNDF